MVELLCRLELETSVEGPNDSSPEALMTSGSVEKKAWISCLWWRSRRSFIESRTANCASVVFPLPDGPVCHRIMFEHDEVQFKYSTDSVTI